MRLPAIPIISRIDPLVRMLLLAIALASVVPVHGSGTAVAGWVANAAIFTVFLLNGLRVGRSEVWRGARNWRFLLPLASWTFGGMLLAGWLLYRVGTALLPQPIALGFLFLGALPSTVQSATAYAGLARGDMAMSVIAAALINLLGIVLTAPLFSLVAGSASAPLDLGALGKIGAVLLLPFIIGQMLQGRLGGWAREQRALLSWADRIAIAIAVYVAFSGAVADGLWRDVPVRAFAWLAGGVAIYLAIGFGGAALAARAARLDVPARISFTFAGAHKSMAMGAPLAALLFPPAVAGFVLVPLLAYHLTQMMVSAPLAQHWARREA